MRSSFQNSQLHDESTFYQSFIHDLNSCTGEIIIESPFITENRAKMFYPTFEALIDSKVKIFIISRVPEDLEENLRYQSEKVIEHFEIIGVQTLLCIGSHHRKLAILDRKILWEGSLNILSQSNSREIMRRIEEEEIALQTFNFLNLSHFI